MLQLCHVHTHIADVEVDGIVGHSTLNLLPVEVGNWKTVHCRVTCDFAYEVVTGVEAAVSSYFTLVNQCVSRESIAVKAIALHLELKTFVYLGDCHLTLCGGIVAQLVTPCALECDTSGEVCCHCNDSKHLER